jgi:O-methyltransferase involved in polyketide biosynthesis
MNKGKTNPQKEKVLLIEAQETLLVPLYSKAMESERPDPIFVDTKAQEILSSVEYDFSKLKVPRKTEITLCIRAKKMDSYTKEFLARYPKSVVLHLGCGLDGRYYRAGNAEVEWYDLDMPMVIDLKRKFFDDTDLYHTIPSSVTDLSWIDTIRTQGRPVLVVAEGLFMYLKGEDVKALILRLKEAFPGCDLVFDAFSTLAAKNANKHPSIKKTGAAINWGIDDATEIERWAKGIKLKEEWYFTQSEDIDKLELGFRIGYRIASLFSTARKAQRILYFNL